VPAHDARDVAPQREPVLDHAVAVVEELDAILGQSREGGSACVSASGRCGSD